MVHFIDIRFFAPEWGEGIFYTEYITARFKAQKYIEEKLFVKTYMHPGIGRLLFLTEPRIPKPRKRFLNEVLFPGLQQFFPGLTSVEFIK